jgi:hypothetical protein
MAVPQIPTKWTDFTGEIIGRNDKAAGARGKFLIGPLLICVRVGIAVFCLDFS